MCGFEGREWALHFEPERMDPTVLNPLFDAFSIGFFIFVKFEAFL